MSYFMNLQMTEVNLGNWQILTTWGEGLINGKILTHLITFCAITKPHNLRLTVLLSSSNTDL